MFDHQTRDAGRDRLATNDDEWLNLVPLPELGHDTYFGFEGGLYPNGKNNPPAWYLEWGKQQAAAVVPRDRDGETDPGGKIVLMSIGMSNASMEFSAFQRLLPRDVNPALLTVDGAQSDLDAQATADPHHRYWEVVRTRLRAAGATAEQVQAVWLKSALAEVADPFPHDARRLACALRQIITDLECLCPNLRLIYLSSRTFGGYSQIALSPEPVAYQSGFAVKWVVEEYIQQMRTTSRADRPWVGWGPYLWTPPSSKSSSVWTKDDVMPDGTHPSLQGRLKVARRLLQFFHSHPTAEPWFLDRGPDQ